MNKNIPGDKCPECGAEEIEAGTPRTKYACGSTNYDGRPGTFVRGTGCKAPPASKSIEGPPSGVRLVKEGELPK